MELIEIEKNRWENEVYTIEKRNFDSNYFWLVIVRKDGQPVRSWKDMQQIKNIVIGPQHEGFELFPSESRLVDERNAYHIWVLRDEKVRIDVGLKYRRVK